MPKASTTNLILTASIAALLGACGGGDPGPGPLKHTLDDMFIARVPIGQKEQVVQTQQSYSLAKMEHAKATADLDDAKVEAGVARNELEQARLGEKSARDNHKAAEKSGDMNRVNYTARMIRTADTARRAADQRLTYLKARVKYLQIMVRLTKEELYAAEARYELAKAKVARDKDIRPKGFTYDSFEKQSTDRERRVQTWQAKANAEKTRMEAERKKWQALEAEAKKARGEPADGEEGRDDGDRPAKPTGDDDDDDGGDDGDDGDGGDAGEDDGAGGDELGDDDEDGE